MKPCGPAGGVPCPYDLGGRRLEGMSYPSSCRPPGKIDCFVGGGGGGVTMPVTVIVTVIVTCTVEVGFHSSLRLSSECFLNCLFLILFYLYCVHHSIGIMCN